MNAPTCTFRAYTPRQAPYHFDCTLPAGHPGNHGWEIGPGATLTWNIGFGT